MRLLLPLLLTVGSTALAAAASLQPADGAWMCDINDTLFQVEIEGGSYRYTYPERAGGNLTLQADGMTYSVDGGTLRDSWGLTQLKFDQRHGDQSLALFKGDRDVWLGACFRPRF